MVPCYRPSPLAIPAYDPAPYSRAGSCERLVHSGFAIEATAGTSISPNRLSTEVVRRTILYRASRFAVRTTLTLDVEEPLSNAGCDVTAVSSAGEAIQEITRKRRCTLLDMLAGRRWYVNQIFDRSSNVRRTFRGRRSRLTLKRGS